MLVKLYQQKMIINATSCECLLQHIEPELDEAKKLVFIFQKLKENVKVIRQRLCEKSYKCSGFKRIGNDNIIYDYIQSQLQFMREDSLTLLSPKMYEENTYMGGIFVNTKANCFYVSLYGGYLVTVNTFSQQKMSVLRLERSMNIN